MPFISASVISPYNSIRGGAEGGLVPTGLLLDLYPNAAAAYSLRKLRTSYSGPAIEARKTVAGETFVQDIGFVGNELDTASLLTFAEGGDVFVAKWYDQSEEGNDAAQVSESAQPQIVSSGLVIKVNNVAAIDFDGTNNYLETDTFTEIPQPTSYFGVFKFDESKNQNIFDGSSANRQLIGGFDATYKLFAGIQITGGITNTNQNSFNGILSTTDSLFINNISVISGNAGSGEIDEIVMGSNIFRNGGYLNGKIQELIFYPSDQSENRADIEANINKNYNIYWDGSQTGLLDDYPNAAAAYSLRALNSAYTGPAIEARKTVGGETFVQNVGFLYDGSLDTESLLSFADGEDVFVAKWYDQSGNGYDSLQPFDAQQPQIVDLGSVVTLNGNPTILSSVGKAMYTASNSVPVVGDLGERSSFSVLNSNASGLQVAISYVDGGTNLWIPIAFNTGIALSRNNDPASNATAPYTANSDVVFTSLLNSTNSEVFLNGVSGGGVTGFIPQTGTSKINVFARYANVWSLVGQVSEIILYPSDQTANRVEIETNINNHYTIYP